MDIPIAINQLRETAKEFDADFISDDYFISIMPESAKTIYADELDRLKEIVGHDIACLREFMDLANDKLLSMTLKDTFQIGIINRTF